MRLIPVLHITQLRQVPSRNFRNLSMIAPQAAAPPRRTVSAADCRRNDRGHQPFHCITLWYKHSQLPLENLLDPVRVLMVTATNTNWLTPQIKIHNSVFQPKRTKFNNPIQINFLTKLTQCNHPRVTQNFFALSIHIHNSSQLHIIYNTKIRQLSPNCAYSRADASTLC
jgi:hypothetical protein